MLEAKKKTGTNGIPGDKGFVARLAKLLTGLGSWRTGRRQRLRDRNGEERQTSTLKVVAGSLILPALGALIIHAVVTDSTAMAIGLMTAASSFAAGALVGFVFGIPRTVQNTHPQPSPGDAAAKSVYEPNTNLEQISDWLTKILVGVGLVQVGQIGGAVDDLAGGLETGLGDNGHAVAVMLMVSFSIGGFLSSYLYTRMRLQNALEPLREALKKQEDNLTNALPLVRSQLDPSGEADPTTTELAEALHDASSGIRDEAFYLARNQRRANWRGEEKHEEKRLVDLVIPVFEALISLDDKNVYHRNYAELAYALKDREDPHTADFERARHSLTTAISTRGAGGATRFPMYEFNRAFCNIKLDPAPVAERVSEEAVADEICKDLEEAAATETGRKAIKGTQLVGKWLERNEPNPRVKALLARLSSGQS